MGYHKDLGTGTVENIDPMTGYPRDKWKHLLDPLNRRDGCPVEGWGKSGATLYNLTSPYGFLSYACGSGDDFHCFDFRVINAGPFGKFIILDATVNSETGSFIQGSGYYVMPCNSTQERIKALEQALEICGDAEAWCCDNDVRHTKKGWNQDSHYFGRAVAMELFDYKFDDKITDRQMRYGGKRVEKIITEILSEKETKP